MDVLIKLIVVNISQFTCILNHHIVHIRNHIVQLKYIQFSFLSHTSIKLVRKKKFGDISKEKRLISVMVEDFLWLIISLNKQVLIGCFYLQPSPTVLMDPIERRAIVTMAESFSVVYTKSLNIPLNVVLCRKCIHSFTYTFNKYFLSYYNMFLGIQQ